MGDKDYKLVGELIRQLFDLYGDLTDLRAFHGAVVQAWKDGLLTLDERRLVLSSPMMRYSVAHYWKMAAGS